MELSHSHQSHMSCQLWHLSAAELECPKDNKYPLVMTNIAIENDHL